MRSTERVIIEIHAEFDNKYEQRNRRKSQQLMAAESAKESVFLEPNRCLSVNKFISLYISRDVKSYLWRDWKLPIPMC